MKKFLTTPIYYANGKPHIGHACTSVVADCIKKSLILQGFDCKLSTGLDEHGQKNQKCIEARNIKPQEYFNEITAHFKELFEKLCVDYDFFINTTSEKHKEVVRGILQKLFDEGKFYKKKSEGLYCVGCEQFKQPSELDENGCCRDHKTKPIEYSEENWFFNLNSEREWLQKILASEVFLTDTYRKEMLNLTLNEIPDLCISRPKDRVWLGIELPFDENFVTFVWFDALINYITVLGYPNCTEDFNNLWSEATHLLAKDIVKPHSIYWPIMLKAIGLPPPKRELVHAYLTAGGTKMGKSLGNGINPYVACNIFGEDALRWILTKLCTKTDAELDYGVLLAAYNTDLANTLGNAFFRIYSLSRKAFENACVPVHNFSTKQQEHLQNLAIRLDGILPRGENIEETSEYIKNLLSEFRSINLYIDTIAPWSIADPALKNQELLCILESLRMLYTMCYPVMPKSALKVLNCLGINFNPAEKLKLNPWQIKSGTVLNETTPLFVRLKEEDVLKLIETN